MADPLNEAAERDESDAAQVLTSRKSSREAPYRPGEMEAVDFVEGLYNDALQKKRDQCKTELWGKDLDVYWGDQWPDALPSYKPPIVINEIKSLVLQELSDLTDSRMKFYVQKRKGEEEQDKMAEDSLKAFWTRNFCDIKLMLAALDAMIFPLGFIQTGWNPMADQGQGEVIFTCRDPATVYTDAESDDEDLWKYWILEDVMDLIDIRRYYPETGWSVQPDDSFSLKSDEQGNRPAPRSGSGYTGPLYSRVPMSGVPGYEKARAQVLTVVVDDPDMKMEIHELGGHLVERAMPVFPHRRLMIVANRRVLYDDDCPYWYAPIVSRVCLQPPVHTYWPRRSIVSEYREVQITANKLDSLVAENGVRMNAGEVFADADSGLTPKNYGAIPGGVTLRRPGSKVEKVYPPPMPPDMIQAGDRFRGMIRQNMGYPLSRTGAGTHGNVAAELAETEISQSMGLTRLRGRLMYQSAQKCAQMLFARMAQFYTTPRHLPYQENGRWKPIKWEPIVDPSTYAVHLDEASFKVMSKTMFQRLVMALSKMNKYPTKRLLEALEIPDADAVASELTQELVLMAAARGKLPKGKGK